MMIITPANETWTWLDFSKIFMSEVQSLFLQGNFFNFLLDIFITKTSSNYLKTRHNYFFSFWKRLTFFFLANAKIILLDTSAIFTLSQHFLTCIFWFLLISSFFLITYSFCYSNPNISLNFPSISIWSCVLWCLLRSCLQLCEKRNLANNAQWFYWMTCYK